MAVCPADGSRGDEAVGALHGTAGQTGGGARGVGRAEAPREASEAKARGGGQRVRNAV